jgi:hypothetical protein
MAARIHLWKAKRKFLRQGVHDVGLVFGLGRLAGHHQQLAHFLFWKSQDGVDPSRIRGNRRQPVDSGKRGLRISAQPARELFQLPRAPG